MFSANSSQVSGDKLFVEDVFSTTVYAGTGSFRGLDVGVKDLATFGAMCWFKSRNAAENNKIFDTARAGFGGGGSFPCSPLLSTNLADFDYSGPSVTFYSTGSTITMGAGNPNGSANYAVWTFRKAPKFFDVVTYTGDGNGSGQTISHALGAVPGCIIIKPTSATGDWIVTSRKGASSYSYGLKLNATNAETGGWTGPSSTTTFNTFIGNTSNETNTNGVQYVAYLFAHDTTSDGIIQCGSFTTGGSPVSVNLGWEPQWLLFKQTSTADDWQISDNMRGLPASSANVVLRPNTTGVEGTNGNFININSTGFVANNAVYSIGTSFIYIAIRRGPMRTPTSGTSVFAPVIGNSSVATGGAAFTGTFPIDLCWQGDRSGGSSYPEDRLRGQQYLVTASTAAEASSFDAFDSNTSLIFKGTGPVSYYANRVGWLFRRAPSFFDVVCYTGTGATRTVNHNLGVAPELVIIKNRSDTSGQGDWLVGYNFGSTDFYFSYLNRTDNGQSFGYGFGVYFTSKPTSTSFNVSTGVITGASGNNYVAYLFASCPGVSKVGSYTGNGSSQTINCGFAAGARFVMIKRTDSTGDWYVWDTARGIVSGNDPRLSLNSTAAEVTTDDSVDTNSSGFVVNQLSATNINVSSATYIYLAVA